MKKKLVRFNHVRRYLMAILYPDSRHFQAENVEKNSFFGAFSIQGEQYTCGAARQHVFQHIMNRMLLHNEKRKNYQSNPPFLKNIKSHVTFMATNMNRNTTDMLPLSNLSTEHAVLGGGP